VEADKLHGSYIDPNAGKVTVKAYGETCLTAQRFDTSTREAVEGRFRRHMYPQLGGRQLRQVRPSTIQAWLRRARAGRLDDEGGFRESVDPVRRGRQR
jgi:hypothetical protein